MADIVFIGHCTRDEITIKRTTSHLPGGGVYFGALSASWCLKRFSPVSRNLLVVTIGNPDDFKRITAEFSAAGCTLQLLPHACTTTFLHSFRDDNPDQRISSIGDIARSFDWRDVSAVRGRLFYVNPLFVGEMDPQLLVQLKANCDLLFLDSQGLIRRQENRLIFHQPPQNLGEILAPVDIFKVDAEEAASLSGIAHDTETACRALLALGIRYLVCTQKEGVAVYAGEKRHWAAFKKWSLEGRTGRGDTVSAAFLVLHFVLGVEIQKAVELAAEGCGNKMMHAGAAVEADFAAIE
jgi:hypothetical protein